MGESGQSGARPPELRAPSGLCVVLLVGYDGRKRSKEFPTRSPKHREPEEAPLPRGVQIDIHVSLLMGFLGLQLSREERRGRKAELPGAGSPQSAPHTEQRHFSGRSLLMEAGRERTAWPGALSDMGFLKELAGLAGAWLDQQS